MRYIVAALALHYAAALLTVQDGEAVARRFLALQVAGYKSDDIALQREIGGQKGTGSKEDYFHKLAETWQPRVSECAMMRDPFIVVDPAASIVALASEGVCDVVGRLPGAGPFLVGTRNIFTLRLDAEGKINHAHGLWGPTEASLLRASKVDQEESWSVDQPLAPRC
ncbi:hypothetical protein M885DRAFT_568122 [Pelagophyceae sp. CCMP2097]|nr:hypothetical protein M885DRAFT_568122 [Pelagophyceae sp. CCMP2097]